MKKKTLYKYYAFVALIICCLAVILTKKVLQNDTFYTIKIGENILKYGVDMKEHFSWIPGLTYMYPHWLYDLAIFLIYDFFGLDGLYLSSLFLYIILGSIMYVVLSKKSKNKFISLLMVLLSMYFLRNFITARAQTVSYIFLFLTVYFIEKFLEKKEKKYVFLLLLMSWLIASCHCAMLAMYLILYLPYLASALIGYLKKKFASRIDAYKETYHITYDKVIYEENKNAKYLLLIMLASIVVSMMNPIGLNAITYFFKQLMGNSMDYISEHQVTTIESNISFFIIIASALFIIIFTDTKVKLTDFFMIAGLSLLTLMSRRSFALFVLLGALPMTKLLTQFLDKRWPEVSNQFIQVLGSYYCLIPLLVASFLGGIYVIDAVVLKDSTYTYIDTTSYPKEAADYILKNIDIQKMKLFNEYNFGSYLLYREIPVFIDSRADLYTDEFSGLEYDIVDDFMNAFDRYEKIIELYDFTHVLIYKNGNLNKLFKADERFMQIYSDNYFVLYKKTTKVAEA